MNVGGVDSLGLAWKLCEMESCLWIIFKFAQISSCFADKLIVM